MTQVREPRKPTEMAKKGNTRLNGTGDFASAIILELHQQVMTQLTMGSA